MLWSTAFHAGPAAWRESSSQEIMQRIITEEINKMFKNAKKKQNEIKAQTL